MASITALLHTENDALRLGRALETLYACDDILIVDHGSRDATVRIAREYGARVLDAITESSPTEASPEEYLRTAANSARSRPSASPRWILCLDPRESLTEKLAASLFEWKSESFHTQVSHTQASHTQASAPPAFSVFLREETAQGWLQVPTAQTRLVPETWNVWNGRLPVHAASALALEGELLRFVFP
jgi:glycosyltransferase involved in cell wall biosynthesis